MSVMKEQVLAKNIHHAIKSLEAGDVIAYPTESCFGLGCDPSNPKAIEKILHLKERPANKGLILIAATIEQAEVYVDLGESVLKERILDSWPGPNTWLLPSQDHVLSVLRGDYPLLAIRVTAHPVAKALCEAFGGAIVSTSANLAGEQAFTDKESVEEAFGEQLRVVSGYIGKDSKPSTIRDGLTGEILRQ